MEVHVVNPVHFVPLAARIASVRINIESARNCDTFGSFKTRKTRKLFIHTAVVLAAQYHSLRFLLFGDQLQGGIHGADRYKEEVTELVIEQQHLAQKTAQTYDALL